MENHPIKANIIDQETLEKLYSVRNKTISNIVCYLWINQINATETISIIDALEFNFSDEDKIILSGNETQEGLTITEYNFEEQKAIIEKEFEGKIKLFKVNASNTEMWKDIKTKKLTNIRLTKDKTSNLYLSDQIIFEFENNEKRLVQIHPLDGIILDYYEEV